MPATFETLLRIDAALVTAGHPPLTEWWKTQLERFYGHPTARTLVARVGRGIEDQTVRRSEPSS